MSKQAKRSSSSLGKKGAEPVAADQGDQYSKIILELAEKAPPKIKPYVVKAAPFIAKLMVLCVLAAPHVSKAIATVDKYVQMLPMHIFRAIIGFMVCFFGGVFPLTIAACEAWKMCGGDEAWTSFKEIRGEFQKALEESHKDDVKDEDGDGKADVSDLTGQELIIRKTKLVLKVVNPELVSVKMGCIYTGWVGVVATLKIQFAKTIALGAAIGDRLYGPAKQYAEPHLMAMVPEEYQKWVPCGLKWTCKAVACYIAWWVQRIISAFHSAIRGGLMCGKELVDFAHEKGWIATKNEDTYLDEIVGWGLAALGFFTQFMLGFSVPFPFNFLMWPMYIVEGFIMWSISGK